LARSQSNHSCTTSRSQNDQRRFGNGHCQHEYDHARGVAAPRRQIGGRHYRVTIAEALAAHDAALGEFGGLPGICNLNSIESAVGRPYSGYHRSIAKKAAALVESIACNHGFIDGNKRTAIHMLGLLLARSGYGLRFATQQVQNNETETMVLNLVNGVLNFDSVVKWMEERLVNI